MKRTLIVVGIGLLAALAVGTFVVLDKGGEFRTIDAHFAGRCTAIGGVVGAEDIVIDHKAKRAWISSDDRRAWAAGNPARGVLYAYDLGSTAAQPIDATPPAPRDFHPHGAASTIVKDLGFIGDFAAERGTSMPVTALVRELFRMHVERGHAEKDSISICMMYDRSK